MKLSATPFCQGLPGSINAVPIPCATIQDSSAFDTNSGPLSERRKAGAPRALTRRDSTSITRGERMRPSTSIASPSLVGHRQTLELLPVGAMVEHEVVGPHLVRPRGRLRPGPARRRPPARTLPRHLQPGGPPQPIGPPGAHPMTITAEKDADAPVAVARIPARELAHPRQCRRVGRGFARSVGQRRARRRK